MHIAHASSTLHAHTASSPLSSPPQWSFPFNTPVDTTKYLDYLNAVKVPMDLGTMRARTESGYYRDPKVRGAM